jgi:hypothetical protein
MLGKTPRLEVRRHSGNSPGGKSPLIRLGLQRALLSLGKIAAGPSAARYYTDQVARGRDDYYAGQQEEPGQWIGAGAEGLEWGGEVDPDVFAHLLDGAGLRRPSKTAGVAGIDLTFRAPKSVSVLWAVAPDDLAAELRAAHDVAVREAFGLPGAGGLLDAAWRRRQGPRPRPRVRRRRIHAPCFPGGRSVAAHARRSREPHPGSGRSVDRPGWSAPVPARQDRGLPLPGRAATAHHRAHRS